MTIDPDINDVVMTANHKENVVNAECRETVSEPNLSTSVQTEASLAKIAIIWTALSLVLMLVWLDEGIVATAIPSISDDFNSLHDIGWYASSYLFALSALQLPFGRVYKDFKAKPTFLTCLFVFEIGSIVQASSPSSVVFIIGRALAGIGGAGVITGALVIFSDEFPARYVPFAMGSIGFTYGIGIVAGPILGGVISKSYLTWRWCFWINPIIVRLIIAHFADTSLPLPVSGRFDTRNFRLETTQTRVRSSGAVHIDQIEKSRLVGSGIISSNDPLSIAGSRVWINRRDLVRPPHYCITCRFWGSFYALHDIALANR